MSVERVKAYLEKFHMENRVMELSVSSATVELAAKALNTKEARIAKTLSFQGKDGPILLVAAGDARIDNGKFKSAFGLKARMLSPEEVLNSVGHAVGGVCPFAIDNPAVKVYLDESLKRFETVFPACGSGSSAVEMNMAELELTSQSTGWVDACKGWQEEETA
jgi:prolyl-tRNA editing enzyme YbaK/EbsC (Cys-tRNA(Pro) deacylase)